MFFWDSTVILLLPALILAIYAQYKVQSTFNKYSRVRSARGLTGADCAEIILRSNGLSRVTVVPTGGMLTDHYNPITKKLYLSEGVYNSDSVAALGVAAHEVGHALQDKFGYLPMKMRALVVPVAGLGSNLAIPLFIIGLIFSYPLLVNLGLLLFAGVVVFHIVTLPVEFNASKRALDALSKEGVLAESEIYGAREVLNAAALTYIAATAMAIIQLLRLLLIARRRD